MIQLVAGGWECALLPEVGGATASLRHQGRDVLRPAPLSTNDPLEAGNFPLVPYANRIAFGRFAVEGVGHELPGNFGDHPHTLHGVGWQAAWHVVDRSANTALLRHDHESGPAWPWRYRAEQHVALAPDGASFSLSLTNLADHPMPSGLGFHPYFPRTSGASVQANVTSAWIADDTMIPIEQIPANELADWTNGAPVERDMLIDNCHGGWDGLARIATNGMTITLTGTGTPWLHLYLPPGADFFCAEPVSHLPDAINRADPAALGLRLVQPGETMRIAMTLSVA